MRITLKKHNRDSLIKDIQHSYDEGGQGTDVQVFGRELKFVY